MLFRVLVWTAGCILGVCLALFLVNWAGAELHEHMPRTLFMVTVQTGYITFLLLPVMLIVLVTAVIVRRVSPSKESPTMKVPKLPFIVLGGLILASHGLLRSQINDLDTRLRGVEVPRTGGVATELSIVAAPLEVAAPDGSVLRGIYEADLNARRVVVMSDDVDGVLSTEGIDPADFGDSLRGLDRAVRMLLELHGWPEERWPEGWSPR